MLITQNTLKMIANGEFNPTESAIIQEMAKQLLEGVFIKARLEDGVDETDHAINYDVYKSGVLRATITYSWYMKHYMVAIVGGVGFHGYHSMEECETFLKETLK